MSRVAFGADVRIESPCRGSQAVALGHSGYGVFVEGAGLSLPCLLEGVEGVPSLPVGGERSKRMAHGSRLASELGRERL